MESIGKQAEAGLYNKGMYVCGLEAGVTPSQMYGFLSTCLARVTFTYTLIQNKR